jgi:hypothetical protein
VSGWVEFEAARLRREELLHDVRRARAARAGKAGGEPLFLRVVRLLGLGERPWSCSIPRPGEERCPAPEVVPQKGLRR